MFGHHPVPVGEHLGEVVPGVHMQQRERRRRRRERLQRQMQHHHGVLAAGEQQHRLLELPGHLPEDVGRLRLQYVGVPEPGGNRRHNSPRWVISAWTAVTDSSTDWSWVSTFASGVCGGS